MTWVRKLNWLDWLFVWLAITDALLGNLIVAIIMVIIVTFTSESRALKRERLEKHDDN